MNGELRRRGINNNINKAKLFSKKENVNEQSFTEEMPLVHESCRCSGFTMMAVASAVLMFVGIIVYAIIV